MPAKFTKMPAYTRKMLMNTAKRCQLTDIEEGRHFISGFYKNNKIIFRSFGIYVWDKNENRKSFLNVNLIKDYEKVTKNTLDKLVTLKGDFVLDNNGDIVKETNASADKVFAYNGKIITASSKEEAIKQIVESAKKAPIQKLTKDQETKLKEMYIDFWPYYCGAVDVGKSGLSGNPKAERRRNKIYEYLKSIYGDDYVYSISTNFDVSLNNLQTKLEDELWNKNVDNVNRWKNRNCRGALFQLAKMSLNDIFDKIKKLDLNKTFEQIIKTDDAINL